jgi:hypothetical protein
LKDLQKAFDVEEAIYFEWAATCSKPRVGEFGGGAVVVKGGEALYMSTNECVDQLLEQHNQ